MEIFESLRPCPYLLNELFRPGKAASFGFFEDSKSLKRCMSRQSDEPGGGIERQSLKDNEYLGRLGERNAEKSKVCTESIS